MTSQRRDNDKVSPFKTVLIHFNTFFNVTLLQFYELNALLTSGESRRELYGFYIFK